MLRRPLAVAARAARKQASSSAAPPAQSSAPLTPTASTSQAPAAPTRARPVYRTIPTDPKTGLPALRVEAPAKLRVVSYRSIPWTGVASDIAHRVLVGACILVTGIAIYDSVQGIRLRRRRVREQILDAQAEDDPAQTARLAEAAQLAAASEPPLDLDPPRPVRASRWTRYKRSIGFDDRTPEEREAEEALSAQ